MRIRKRINKKLHLIFYQGLLVLSFGCGAGNQTFKNEGSKSKNRNLPSFEDSFDSNVSEHDHLNRKSVYEKFEVYASKKGLNIEPNTLTQTNGVYYMKLKEKGLLYFLEKSKLVGYADLPLEAFPSLYPSTGKAKNSNFSSVEVKNKRGEDLLLKFEIPILDTLK